MFKKLFDLLFVNNISSLLEMFLYFFASKLIIVGDVTVVKEQLELVVHVKNVAGPWSKDHLTVLPSISSSEIVDRLMKPPPLCRPVVSVDEAPAECLNLMNECWNEDPTKRPTFDDIFKQVRPESFLESL